MDQRALDGGVFTVACHFTPPKGVDPHQLRAAVVGLIVGACGRSNVGFNYCVPIPVLPPEADDIAKRVMDQDDAA